VRGIQLHARGLVRETCSRACPSRSGCGEVIEFQRLGGVLPMLAGSSVILARPKSRTFRMPARGDEDVGWLDVAVDDAFGVCGIQCVGNLEGEREEQVESCPWGPRSR
jgi:hypothetical protein